MVNLLVVALLLASSLAVEDYGVEINDFQFLCMKQDGSYVPLADTQVTATGRDGDEIFNVRTDNYGRLTESRVISYGRNVQIGVWIMCIIYASQCPAVANECQFSWAVSYKEIPYEEYEEAFKNRGHYALITPRNEIVTTSLSELPRTKMTVAQFCEPPYGKEVRECHYKALDKRSNNADNGTATADFNKSRPARLAKAFL